MPKFEWTEEDDKSYRWLIYGVAGVGKTTESKYLEGKTFLLALDESFKRIPYWKQNKEDIWIFDPIKPIEDLQDFVRWFNPSDYDNLVVDNVSNLQKMWFIEKAKDSKNGLDNQIAHYNEFVNWIIRFISHIFHWKINILVTAWETQTKVTDANGQEFMQYGPDLRVSARDYLMGNCDVVGRLIQNPKNGERGIILQGDIGTYAKNRLDNRKAVKASELFSLSLSTEASGSSKNAVNAEPQKRDDR